MQIVRLAVVATLAALAMAMFAAPRPARADAGFDAFVAALRPDAAAAGVSRQTFERAFAGVAPDPAIIARTRAQAEFSMSLGAYLSRAVTTGRAAQGQRMARRWEDALRAIEERSGVEREIVLAIWGMETNYGAVSGGRPVIASLASLAYAGYRGDFFRKELLAALRILEDDHIPLAGLRGSWAGAMGQPQFMPSTFLAHAVDFDGDGRRDIWSSVPDSLASIAAFLEHLGWRRGTGWGREARLPRDHVLTTEEQSAYLPYAQWRQRNVLPADGGAWPAHGEARLMLPAGLSGPALLVTPNFEVVRGYNASTSYILAIVTLADRIAGRRPLRARWPDSPPPRPEPAREAQRALQRLGYDVGAIDGRFGERARAALRRWQDERGAIPDGEPTPAVVEALRSGR